MIRFNSTKAAGAIVLAGALALGACGKKEEPSYTADATDESGGQLQVTDQSSEGVPVNVPETAMTPAPDAAASSAPAH